MSLSNALKFTKLIFFYSPAFRPGSLYHVNGLFAYLAEPILLFFISSLVFFFTSLLIIFILLALSYQMLRDFINIYELFLVFLDEGKHINTISIYSPAIPSVCRTEWLFLTTPMVFATKPFTKILNSAFLHVVPQAKQVSFTYQKANRNDTCLLYQPL